MDNYFELIIDINPEISDVVSDICFTNFDCEGVILAEEAYKDLEMISTTEGELKAFLTSKPDNAFVARVLTENRSLLIERGFTEEDLGSWAFVITEKENQDWSKKWKEKWDVTHVSEKITIVPSWLTYTPKNEDEVIITLDPGCAFGTGTHATTQLCMLAMEKYFKSGQTLADIGMGSGILSICGKKFGATYVYGCDNDETVIDVAKENAVINGVTVLNIDPTQNSLSWGNTTNDGVVFELNTADKVNEKFDFVCANILHNVLAEIMGDLKNLMKQNAYMSLSGILDEKKPVVLEAIKRENLEIIEEIHLNQWTSFVVQRKD